MTDRAALVALLEQVEQQFAKIDDSARLAMEADDRDDASGFLRHCAFGLSLTTGIAPHVRSVCSAVRSLEARVQELEAALERATAKAAELTNLSPR